MGGFIGPVGQNQAGNISFVPFSSTFSMLGTYRWDAMTQTVTTVAMPGMTTADGLLLSDGADIGGAGINNSDQILFIGAVKDAGNQKVTGIFLKGVDGQIRKVLLPGDPLPGRSAK